jgi:hypothetical protein
MGGGLMRGLIETLGGLWELFLLAVGSRFRVRGPYWRWRYETAFGGDPAARPPRRQRLRAMLDYGRWVYRMKRRRWRP